MSLNRRIFCFAITLLTFSLSLFDIQSSDIFMYIAIARQYWDSGLFWSLDPFIFEASSLYHLQQWLTSIVFERFYQWTSWTGVIGAKASVLSMTVLLATQQLIKHLQGSWARVLLIVFVIILGLFAASFRFIERGSIFSDLLLVIMLLLMPRERLTLRHLCGFFLVFLLWVQLHPGFPVGLLVYFAYFGAAFLSGSLRKNEFWKVLLPPLALLINPNGISGVLYPFNFFSHEAQFLRSYVFEWFPTYHLAFRWSPEVCAYWTFLLLVAFLAQQKLRSAPFRKNLPELAILAIAFVGGISSIRFVPWSVFLCWIVLGRLHSKSPPRSQAGEPLIGFLSFVVLGLSVAIFVNGYPSSSGFRRLTADRIDRQHFPSEVLDFYRKNRIAGQLFAPRSIGDYLVFEGLGRVFEHGFVTDFALMNQSRLLFSSVEHFEKVTQGLGITMLMLDRAGTYHQAYQILKNQDRWKIVAEDPATILIYRF